MSTRTPERFDAVVIGGGPAGSATAFYLASAGVKVLVLEREPFPRFHVGESLTGTAGDFIRELGLEADMARLDFPAKPGVKVIGHAARSEFFVPVLRPTWQVQRAAFDQLVLERARAGGAQHRRGSVERVLRDGDRVSGVVYRDGDGLSREIHAAMVVDATGERALLSREGVAGPREVEEFGRQIAIYAQLEGVVRDEGAHLDATVIFYDEPLHWAWLIPVSSTSTSIGIVLPTDTYKRYGDSPDAVFAWGLANLNPDLARRVRRVTRTEPVRVSRNYSYRIDPFVGPGWICVGDAHRFTDPIFSFGVSFALTGAREAARAIVASLAGRDEPAELARYAEHCTRGHDAAADLIRYFWRFPAFFAFQTRGERRDDVIRLLAGDCFEDPPLAATVAMRRSLESVEMRESA